MAKTIALAGAQSTLGVLLHEVLSAQGHTVVALDGQHSLADQHVDLVYQCAFPQTEQGSSIAEGLRETKKLAEEAQVVSVGAFVLVSSQRVYSPTKESAATEETPVDPGSRYGVGIFAAEQLCDSMLGEIPHTAIRLATLYGENANPLFLNKLVEQVVSGKPFVAHGYEQLFGLVSYVDAAQGLAVLAESDPKSWEPVYNLGAKTPGYTYDRILRALVETAKARGLQPVFSVDYDSPWQNSAVDSARFMETFGWSSRLGLKDVVEEIFDEFVVAAPATSSQKKKFGLFGRKG